METLFINLHKFSDYIAIYSRGFMIQNARYFVFAGLAFLLFFVWKKKQWGHRKIWLRPLNRIQIRREIKWSLLTGFVLGFVYIGIAWLTQTGFTKIYLPFDQYGWWYLFLSVVIMVFWHDTWFYWIHRLLHWGPLLRKVHRVHHLSSDPTPFAAFAFHPVETLLEAGFVIIAIFVIPLHPLAILFTNFFQMTMNVIGHSGHELFPEGFCPSPFLQMVQHFHTPPHASPLQPA